MPGSSSAVGFILLIIGLLVLGYAFFLGYGLYKSLAPTTLEQNNALNNSPINASASGSSSITVNTSVSNAMRNVASSLITDEYTFIDVILLFLFASVGYKLAALGIKMTQGPDIKIEKDSSSKVGSSEY